MKEVLHKIGDVLNTIFHAFFRYYNFPCQCGLIRIGNPDKESPVFLSGNYSYVVKLLKKVLTKTGIDCYLLVADASGSNVWCAAGMNEFTEHDVVDAINATELADLVSHRRIIAPPYAAPGVDVKYVTQETGFRIRWGPTHLRDIPRYVENNYKRTNDMLAAQWTFRDRIDLALCTALAYSMTAFWPMLILIPLLGITWWYYGGLVLVIFGVHLFCFALWDFLPTERYWRKTLLTTAVLSLAMVGISELASWQTTTFILWEAVLLGVVFLVAADQCGSTALYKTTIVSWLKTGNYESLFQPVIDPEMCTNCGACILVCPRNVFARLSQAKKVVVVHPNECMECLACVKHCDDLAIFNKTGKPLKGDVKTIPNLVMLATRDTSHLKHEDRWIGVKTRLKGELPIVLESVEEALTAEIKPESKVQATEVQMTS